MATLFSADFEDGSLGVTVNDPGVFEGIYVVGHDGTGGDGGLGLGQDDPLDLSGVVRFQADTATVVDAGTVGLDFVRRGPYAPPGPRGVSLIARVGHMDGGSPSDFGVLLGLGSDGSIVSLTPDDAEVFSDPGLVAEDVWYQGTITWSGMDVAFKVTRYSDGATIWEHADVMTYPPVDRALWFPALTANSAGTAYEAHIDNAFYGTDVVEPPPVVVTDTATRMWPRKDNLGPMASAPRLVGEWPPERIIRY